MGKPKAQDGFWGERWLWWDIGCRWSWGEQVWVLSPSVGPTHGWGGGGMCLGMGFISREGSKSGFVLGGLSSVLCIEVCQVSAVPSWDFSG